MDYRGAAELCTSRFDVTKPSDAETISLVHRIIAANPPESLVNTCCLVYGNIEAILWKFEERPADADALLARLNSIMAPWSTSVVINMDDGEPDYKLIATL